jgi:glycine/D-amino acid oxidase-like deaminating enzyme
MSNVATLGAEEVGECREAGLGCSSLEGMSRVVTMLGAHMAVHAEIVVLTGGAGDKLLLGEH